MAEPLHLQNHTHDTHKQSHTTVKPNGRDPGSRTELAVSVARRGVQKLRQHAPPKLSCLEENPAEPCGVLTPAGVPWPRRMPQRV